MELTLIFVAGMTIVTIALVMGAGGGRDASEIRPDDRRPVVWICQI